MLVGGLCYVGFVERNDEGPICVVPLLAFGLTLMGKTGRATYQFVRLRILIWPGLLVGCAVVVWAGFNDDCGWRF